MTDASDWLEFILKDPSMRDDEIAEILGGGIIHNGQGEFHVKNQGTILAIRKGDKLLFVTPDEIDLAGIADSFATRV